MFPELFFALLIAGEFKCFIAITKQAARVAVLFASFVLFMFFLSFHRKAREGNSEESFFFDRFAGFFADAITAIMHSLDGFFDLIESILFGGDQA